ncbi:hypothetical protein LZY01_20040 [Levilactobacillus zymae]|uniref:DUF1642 domain-containing protein n=1 Tax=Levilactobacillus zymae TaxID=267363 RepID=A0ABQ0WYL7_9LACO|nr:DUF1642 domain-containing protein [Levilactobacillus zymae]GEO72836.1 hypothetical protein LZY01_20040 [Levilactobacillus zymae]
MNRYVKTIPIEAEQFEESVGMINKYDLTSLYNGQWSIDTLEGGMVFNTGDWIATGINGEHWAIADDVFQKTYMKLPVIPEAVSNVLIYAKSKKRNLYWVFTQTPNNLARLKVIAPSERREISGFFRKSGSDEIFARAWLDGYQVTE